LLNLLEPLAAEGFDISVVCFQEEARRWIPAEFTTYAFKKKVGAAKYYLQYVPLTIRMARIFREERPDVILCNSYQPFWICMAARMLSGSKAVLITGEQNNLTVMFRDAKWGQLRSYLVSKLDPHADCIIVPSRDVADQMVRDFNIPAKKIFAIPNSIDLRRIEVLLRERTDHPWFETKDQPIILHVGVLDRQKDQETLLKAFSLVRQTIPARCVLVGDGPLQRELECKAKELGISDNVAFLGFQKNPFKFMARADVFVLSSLYEGFLPLVLMEAMACGCPVVSTRCPFGPEEILAPSSGDVAGLLAPISDPKSLAECMLKVLSDRSLRRRLSENGRLRAQDFSADKIAHHYANLIRRFVGSTA
jgi:glycosyltransferase involved in cell wall biosynthesis